MRNVLVLLSCLLAIGCSSPEPFTPLPIPPRSEKVDMAPLKESSKEVIRTIVKVVDASEEVKAQLEEAKSTARASEDAARDAYENGLEKGSQKARSLSESVTELRVALERTQEKSKEVSDLLVVAENEATKAQKEVERVEFELLAVQTDLELNRLLLDEANVRLSIAEKIREEFMSNQEKLDKSRVWTRRWFFGFMGLAALVGVYIYARVSTVGIPRVL